MRKIILHPSITSWAVVDMLLADGEDDSAIDHAYALVKYGPRPVAPEGIPVLQRLEPIFMAKFGRERTPP